MVFSMASLTSMTHTARMGSVDAGLARYSVSQPQSHQYMHSGEVDGTLPRPIDNTVSPTKNEMIESGASSLDLEKEKLATISFEQQIAAFLILEFGVLFHSVIIGESSAMLTAG